MTDDEKRAKWGDDWRLIDAIESGKLPHGDLVFVDKDGNPTHEKPPNKPWRVTPPGPDEPSPPLDD